MPTWVNVYLLRYREMGGMSEMFTVGQAKCITCINTIYTHVGLMGSLYYTDEEIVKTS